MVHIASSNDINIIQKLCLCGIFHQQGIPTAKIEELLVGLKEHYTIVLVTHNMQQAARVSDHTGFMLMGRLVEFDATENLFTNPSQQETEDYITGRFG